MRLRLPPLAKRQRILAATMLAAFIAAAVAILRFAPAPPPEVAVITPPPIPAPAAPTPTDADAPKDNATLILELFNPDDQSLTHQLNETALSQQIEQVISVSFVLAKCNIISTEEYANSFRALHLYAQRMHLAPDAQTTAARIRQITESASTSYALIYSRTKCDSPQLPGLKTQLITWQKAMLNN